MELSFVKQKVLQRRVSKLFTLEKLFLKRAERGEK